MKTCKKGLEYESSSQSQTMSSCQSSEEAEKANKANTDWKPAKPENKTQPIMKRRSSRCVPLDENVLKKHNNDKSESESDGSIFNVPRSRQSRQLCQSQDDTTDNDDDHNKKKDNKTKNSTTDIEAVDKVKDSNLKEVSKDKTDIGKGDDKTTKCSSSNTRDQQQKVAQSIHDNIHQQTNQKLGNDNAKDTNDPKQQSDVTQILSDSDTVEVIVLSPQRKRRKSLSKHSHSRSPETFRKDLNAKASNEVDKASMGTSKSVHTIDTSDSESEIDLQRTPRKRKNLSLSARSSDRKSTPSKQDKTKETKESTNKAGTDTDEAPQYVVEISTDSECSESQKNSSKLRKRIPSVLPESPSVAFSIKSRITRSSPQVLSTPKLSEDILSPKKDRKNNSTSNSSETPLVMGEISSQLEAIRKELECLEALRLADLKHRTCKA